jgi:uncharacterized protein (TIGR02001 family)
MNFRNNFVFSKLNPTIMKRRLCISLIGLMLMSAFPLSAQEDENGSQFNTTADIFNRYVWRGLDYGSAPSIQPGIEYAHKSGFAVGYWGAFSTTGSYNEIDLYLSYSLSDFDIVLTDYFFPVSGVPSFRMERYLNFDNETTGHGTELSLVWNGTEKIPLTLTAGTFIWGADKNNDGDQNYSTYIEAKYEFDTKAGKLEALMGFTPADGLYGNTLGVINIGLGTSREIKMTDHFSLPIQSAVIVNPQTSNIYLLFGITL